jgi:hypothetical protein
MSEEAKVLWELLKTEREAARRADAMGLLTLQSMKRDAMEGLAKVPDHERMELVRYARENLRRIRTLLSCYEGSLGIEKAPQTYGNSGRLRVTVGNGGT